jgi:1-acyl-sn-glycerol-3-phosphate acyltransferase
MIRNFLFSIFFYFGIILISIIFLPSFFLPQKVVLVGGKLMGFWAGLCLKTFLSTKIVIKGKENIICNEKFLIASSHQSMFETFFLQTIFNSPIFILKKELLKIPIFGWYLIKIGSISIDRGDRPIIIFPQGTRLNPKDRSDFKKGASRIYDELKIKCQPVAINSGYTWPKRGMLEPNKSLTISILKPIEPGFKKEEFLQKLQIKIYNELDNLN